MEKLETAKNAQKTLVQLGSSRGIPATPKIETFASKKTVKVTHTRRIDAPTGQCQHYLQNTRMPPLDCVSKTYKMRGCSQKISPVISQCRVGLSFALVVEYAPLTEQSNDLVHARLSVGTAQPVPAIQCKPVVYRNVSRSYSLMWGDSQGRSLCNYISKVKNKSNQHFIGACCIDHGFPNGCPLPILNITRPIICLRRRNDATGVITT